MESLPEAPPGDAEIVLSGEPAGTALLVSYEWPNADHSAVDSYFAEPPVEWPAQVPSGPDLAARITTSLHPWSVERWFYTERDDLGLPVGESKRTTLCPYDDLDNCGSYDPESGVLLFNVPDYGETGLMIVQVEWPTPPSTGSLPLVARASWAVELLG